MRRIVLLLIFASVVMFAVVLKTPLRTLRSVVFPEDDSTSVTPVPQKQAPSTKKTGAKARSASSSPELAKLETVEGNSISTAGAAAANEAKAPGKRIPANVPSSSSLTISTDAVALYSNNSTRGSILRLLKKGTVVIPTLQVQDGDVSWVLVRVPELNVSGFIQAEQLISSLGERTADEKLKNF